MPPHTFPEWPRFNTGLPFQPPIIEEMAEKKRATCALDCPDACSLVVTVEGGRALKLGGAPQHPVTQGFLCAKVARYLERAHHPDRLLHPVRRTGSKGSGRFEPISWNAALDTIAEKLAHTARTYGSEAILPYSYAGTMGLLNGSGMDRRFFHRLGASHLDRTICASAGTEGLMAALGSRYGLEPQDFVHAKLIIAWGANVMSTNVHLWPFIVEARRRGARFYVIDPVHTKTARLSDWHLAPYPGSDLALALGVMHVLFRDGLTDEAYLAEATEGSASLRQLASDYTPQRVSEWTGLPAGDIERLAQDYGTLAPAAIRTNYGVQRSERGGRAIQAISLLPALVGAWRTQGGGVQLSTSGAFPLNRAALEMPELQQIPLRRPARVVNMSLLGKALTELDGPRVHALYVYNSNPAAIAPNQKQVLEGLCREDLFTVVAEHFMTDTARYADIVLPATNFLEHTDLYTSYGHYELQLALKACDAPGEARSNVEVFRALAQRMGFTEPCFEDSEETMIRALLDTPHPFLRGITWERLVAEHSIRVNIPELPFAHGGFGTPSGKANLSAEHLAYTPPEESRKGSLAGTYPLELVSSKNHDSLNSTFGFRAEVDAQTAVLEMHRDDASARGVIDGHWVEIFNDRGRCRLKARVNDGVRPGVVRAPMVRWGVNVNQLISDRLTDIGGGPTFYNCLVDVRPCGD